jgi:hypothetical protein
MGSLVQLTRRTALAPRPQNGTRTAPFQLHLIFDDVRLRGMTMAERQALLRALARLLLEVNGAATRGSGDDNA